MDPKDSIQDWQKANELFEIYADCDISESIEKINHDDSVSLAVKKIVIKLMKSLHENVNTIIDEADNWFLRHENIIDIDLSGNVFGEYLHEFWRSEVFPYQ